MSVRGVLYFLADVHSAAATYFNILGDSLKDSDKSVTIREGEPCSQQC